MEHVRVDMTDGIAVVTLDRPPVNALAHQTFAELAEPFESFGSGRDVSVAMLASSGGKAFCGGVDLADSPRRYRPDGRQHEDGPQGDAADQIDPGRIVRRCFWSIYECGVPVIAAVDGKVIGAGCALVASCDLIVASTRSTFSLAEINVGVLGGVRHMQRMVGPFLSKRMLLTGEAVSAAEVYRRGALEAVVEPDEVLPTASALAATIAAKSPIAVRLAKESANRVEALSLQDGYRLEQDYTGRVRRHADAAEAARAFSEKRPAVFSWE